MFKACRSPKQFRLEAGGAWVLGTNGDKGWVLLSSDDTDDTLVVGDVSQDTAQQAAVHLLEGILARGLEQLQCLKVLGHNTPGTPVGWDHV